MRLRTRQNNRLAVASPTGRQHHSQTGKYRFLWVVNSLMIGVLLIWLIVGNSLATNLEAPVQQAIADLAQQFPARQANPSAIRLHQLAERITPFRSKTSFDEYLAREVRKQGGNLAPLPLVWHQYIAAQSQNLAALRNHLLTKELPKFAQPYDVKKADGWLVFSDSRLQWLKKDRKSVV